MDPNQSIMFDNVNQLVESVTENYCQSINTYKTLLNLLQNRQLSIADANQSDVLEHLKYYDNIIANVEYNVQTLRNQLVHSTISWPMVDGAVLNSNDSLFANDHFEDNVLSTNKNIENANCLSTPIGTDLLQCGDSISSIADFNLIYSDLMTMNDDGGSGDINGTDYNQSVTEQSQLDSIYSTTSGTIESTEHIPMLDRMDSIEQLFINEPNNQIVNCEQGDEQALSDSYNIGLIGEQTFVNSNQLDIAALLDADCDDCQCSFENEILSDNIVDLLSSL